MTNRTDDDWMRRLLEDAVTDVTPRAGLDEIRARTARSTHGRRGWLWGAGAAVVATAATVAAVVTLTNGPGTSRADHGFAGSGTASSQARHSGSSQSTATSGPAPSAATAGASPQRQSTGQGGPAAATVTVPVYFLGETPQGPRLYRDDQPAPAATAAVTAVHAALAGNTLDPDYGSPWPTGTDVTRVTSDGSGLTVALQAGGTSLATRPAGMTRQTARIAVQQLVHTAQDAVGSQAPVSFTVDGTPAQRLLGVDVSGGVKRASDLDVEALVWVLSPAQGTTVHSPFTVKGLADTFEANVLWELRQHGHVVEHGQTTAAQAMMMAPYSFSVRAPAGHYTLVVHDSNASGRGKVTQDTKAITVR